MSYSNLYIELLDDMICSRVDFQFKNEVNFLKTEKLAKELAVKNTLEGYISSIFIFHQLVENYIDYIIDSYNYFLKRTLFPLESDKILKSEKYFSGKCNTLERTPLQAHVKEELLPLLQKINTIRNELAHNILSIDDLKSESNLISQLYEEIISCFRDEEGFLDQAFGEYHDQMRDNKFEYLEEYLLHYIEDYQEYINTSKDIWYKYLKERLGKSIHFDTAREIRETLLEIDSSD